MVMDKEVCVVFPKSGFGRKGTDEENPQKRKSKQVAATLDSAVEPRRSSRFHGVSNRRNCTSEEKLNSCNFDCYLKNIWSELPEDKKSLFLCLDSMWFSSYTTKAFKPKVLRWIKNKNIFSKKYVLVPIVLWNHWCLLIFCHLGESLESESTTPCMLLLDSLQMANLQFEPEIRKFVSDIFKTEERPESQKLIKKIKLLVPKVPQQKNDTDCGKYVLYYISLFLDCAPENFSISEGYPYFMKEDWFTLDQLESFWQKLQTQTKDSSEESSFSDGSFSGSEDVILKGEDLNMLDGQSKHQTPTLNSGRRQRSRKATGDAIVDAMLEFAAASKMRAAAIMRNEERFAISKCIKVLDEMQGVDQSIYLFALNLFENPNARETFIALKTERRLTWLQCKFNLGLF
ncbi:probable ubiquitin-like-specific protease 2B isoform X2 [Lycium ferocissimum]|uniref:probable ubiquitin-like-specific protease 2B isoform X2 n=1 Tax=Lycium ferocissimum TaxID=112874 RepID=UPI00281584F6|nr:probable ubiquitin-like-specific protease 2B isoform X2 [Lycium ferocissimum]